MLKCDEGKSALLRYGAKAFYSDKEREAACKILAAVDSLPLFYAEDLLRNLANELHFFAKTTTAHAAEVLSNEGQSTEPQPSQTQPESQHKL